MKLDGRFEYKKALILTPERVKELEAILLKYCKEVSYEATTVADTDISFASSDELFSYDNFQSRRIRALTVTGRVGLDRIVTCAFEAGGLRFLVGYDETCICKYTVSNVDVETTLKDDILTFLKKVTASFWLLSKFRLFGLLGFVSLYLFLPMIFIIGGKGSGKTTIPGAIVSILIGFLFVNMVRLFDRYFLERMFPPITFLWGEEQTRYEKSEGIRKNVFWGVLIAIAAGVIGNIIYNQLIS